MDTITLVKVAVNMKVKTYVARMVSKNQQRTKHRKYICDEKSSCF